MFLELKAIFNKSNTRLFHPFVTPLVSPLKYNYVYYTGINIFTVVGNGIFLSVLERKVCPGVVFDHFHDHPTKDMNSGRNFVYLVTVLEVLLL